MLVANKSLQATARNLLRVPGYPRSLCSLGALERGRYATTTEAAWCS